MKLDLHLHSTVSDGSLSPAALVHAAARAGLGTIALTDHDTTAGVPEARSAALEVGVRVVPGIEISTRTGGREYHVLGYWLEPDHPVVLAHQSEALARREHRMLGMVEKLRAIGVSITFDDVLRAAGPGTLALGRPHLARALLAAGHVRSFADAFTRYLADGGVAYVAERFPDVPTAIEIVHAAGGMAVWAHPDLDRFDAEIHAFRDAGLDGVECFRPSLTPAELAALYRRIRQLGLAPTGGSDWHGPGRAALGEFYVRPHEVRELLDWPARAPLDPAPCDGA